MDLLETLRDLYAQRERLERVIATLEELARDTKPSLPAGSGKRRGRKSMGAEERHEVSKRMRRYWETRRSSAKEPARKGSSSVPINPAENPSPSAE
jgi:hypothetical protein